MKSCLALQLFCFTISQRTIKVAGLFFFLVQQSGRKEINAQLKKEADYFGDIVIVPYVDTYDLVVLKTVAICEYGVSDDQLKVTVSFCLPCVYMLYS